MAYETRTEIKKWMRDAMDGEEVVSTTDLAREAIDHFKADENFVQAFLNEGLYPLMHKLASEVMNSTRGTMKASDVQTANVRMTREEIRRRAQNLSKFVTWREHVPARDGHVKLMDMTRIDLLSAAQSRRLRSQGELAIATFEETLAARMTSETQTVGEAFTEDELDRIYSAMKQGEAA